MESHPFFILGYPRSGTTALARLVNASQEAACVFYEGNLLYRLHRILSRRRVLDEPHSDLLADFSVTARHNLLDKPKQTGAQKPLFSEKAVSILIDRFAEDLTNIDQPQQIYRNAAKGFFQMLADVGRFSAVGDKVPDYISIPEELKAALPKARMLYVTRDPRATVHSAIHFAAKNLHLFATEDALSMAFAWLLRFRWIERFRRENPAAQILSLSQEQLKSDPLAVAEKATSFLGISVDDSLRSHAQSSCSAPGVKNWREEMAPDDVEAVEAVLFYGEVQGEQEFTKDPRRTKWGCRAEALMPLASGAGKDIPELVENAKPFFKGPQMFLSLSCVLVQLAEWSHVRSEDERSRSYFEAVLRLAPTDPIFYYKYGEFCFDTKRLSLARRLFQTALEKCPPSDYFRFLRAKALVQLGRTERLRGEHRIARTYFEKSITEYPPFLFPKAMLTDMDRAGGSRDDRASIPA